MATHRVVGTFAMVTSEVVIVDVDVVKLVASNKLHNILGRAVSAESDMFDLALFLELKSGGHASVVGFIEDPANLLGITDSVEG